LGREHFIRRRPPRDGSNGKTVVVVGGGPAGMEAALTAAGRGLNVHLFEKEDRLGGQVELVARIPGKAPWKAITPFYRRRLEQHGVHIHLGQSPQADRIGQIGPDAVVLATGAAPGPGVIEVTGPGAMTAFTALADPDRVGHRAAIVGGQRLAVDTALYLAALGRRVTVLCRGNDREYLMSGITPTLRPHIRESLDRADIDVQLGASCLSVEKGCALVEINGQGQREMDFDSVILATAPVPIAPDWIDRIGDWGAAVYRIGDCLAPRSLGAALVEGFEAGALA
jgi:pyruvate/2-oxoglutarate dehydrogenase complex dihydrolipoamide dehydrogenase (E3) component